MYPGYSDPPVHPNPSFFETTEAVVEDPADPLVRRVITHLDIEEILAEPAWDVRNVQSKITANLVLRGWKQEGDLMVPPKPRQPKKAAAKKTPPRKKS